MDEFRSHHFETMIETIVRWHFQGNHQGFLGGAGFHPSTVSLLAPPHIGHGHPPVNIPIPTKIGSKMGGEFTYPRMVLVLTHSQLLNLKPKTGD